MIKRLYVDNFKAFNEFEIKFSNMNVLIGGNGAGKSTLLQSLDFIKNFISVELSEFMKTRQWKAEDLSSKLTKTVL